MEYEYSYRVTDLTEYLEYVNQNYEFKEMYKEKRVIYRGKGTIARITYKEDDMYLDFKEDKLRDDGLITRKESKQLKIEDVDAAEDILSFLGYKKDNTISRYRSIYTGDGIKFEIDEYIEPKGLVFSFEGEKNICDKVDLELKDLHDKYKI